MGTTILADLQDGQQVTVETKPVKKNNLPPFDGFGGNMRFKTKVSPYPNLITTMKELSKNAAWMWWSLLEKRNHLTNECRFKAKDPAEARKITMAYKELKKHQLVIRLKRQHYIMNPRAYLPDFSKFEEVDFKWCECARVLKLEDEYRPAVKLPAPHCEQKELEDLKEMFPKDEL